MEHELPKWQIWEQIFPTVYNSSYNNGCGPGTSPGCEGSIVWNLSNIQTTNSLTAGPLASIEFLTMAKDLTGWVSGPIYYKDQGNYCYKWTGIELTPTGTGAPYNVSSNNNGGNYFGPHQCAILSPGSQVSLQPIISCGASSVPEPFHLWMALAPQPALVSSMVFSGNNYTGPESANFAATVIANAISNGTYSGSGPFYVQNSNGDCYQYIGPQDPAGNQVWTLAGINSIPYNGVVDFTYGQAGGYPLCSVVPPLVSYNCTPSGCIDPGNGSGTYSTLAACQNVCRYRCLSNNCVQAAGGPFASLNDCINAGCGNIPTYNVCDNPNTAAFWQFGYDCFGVAIPASVIANPSTANIIAQAGCCPSCISIYANSPTASGYSSQPLTCTVNGVNPTTINGTDGYISITVRDGGFTASGAPQGLITGNSTYKYVLENNNAAATISGNAVGVKVGSGTAGVSQASFTFGNSLTIAANGGNGLLQTGAAGSATYVATTALGYVPAATGTLNTTGLQAGTYTVYVYDSSQKTPCLCKSIVTLTNPPAISGCTDPTSLTYNAAATINTASACQYCDAITGTLENNAGTVIPHMSVTGSPYISNPVTSSVATNGSINITGVNAIAPFTTYVNNVTDAGTLLPNADYKISLHRWNTQTSTANSAWAGPTLTNFNSNTSLIGTVNNQGLGFNNVLLNTASLGGGITYGYYTIKFYIDDPDGTVEIEQCYYLLDVVVKVPVCYDNGIATTIDGVVITDPNLYVIDNTICLSINNYCCQSATFAETTSNGCNIGIYTGTVSCNPLPSTISYGVEMLNPSTGLWNIVLPLSVPQVFASSPFSAVGTFMQNVVSANGYGTFRMVFVSSYGPAATPTSNPCTIYSNNVVISPAITGCPDPTALNYNAAASCPGPCTYCVYGCMDPLALNYDPNATCDDGSCTYPIPGCMDPTASNYNPLATVDDGSCIYASCGCTDPTALNYGKNCLGNYVGLPPSCDDGCCQYCDPTSLSSGITIVPATSTGVLCNSNCDASFTITVNSTACTSVWHLINLQFYSNVTNSWQTVGNSGVYAYGVPVTFSNLCAENYILSIEDCYGCPVDIPISIGTNNPACGCTDPNATNYNPLATIDDGSCMFCGCMDPNASNYNPGATSPCIPEICEYVAPSSPCVPGTIEETFLLFEECIAVNGTSYYNKLITGLADECSTMNTWKLILMDYLLKRVGLECIYNCLDSGTPTPDTAYNTCEDLWITGGPSTGLNDLSVNTLGIGTTITDFSATSTSTLYPGDVIKHGTSGNIWLFYGPPGQTSMQLLDPESASGGISGFWMYCNNNMRYTFKGYNINYLDSFINFVNKFCSDCKNNVINRKSKYYLA